MQLHGITMEFNSRLSKTETACDGVRQNTATKIRQRCQIEESIIVKNCNWIMAQHPENQQSNTSLINT
ncbi:hypothetical protein FKM82_026333 [Ascaphus truei]